MLLKYFYFLFTENARQYLYRYLGYLSISGATTANNSLFTYDEGKSHSSYFDAGYVPIFLDQDDVAFDNATLGQQAREVCGDNKQCLFDIHTTGKVSIGMASKQAVESFVAIINETETPGKKDKDKKTTEHGNKPSLYSLSFQNCQRLQN